MNNNTADYRDKFSRLVEIMDRLRGEKGCPWDKEQDHKTLMPYLVEETYEVIEAIEEESPKKMCEELGDLLLQIVFHSRIASEDGRFDIGDVCDSICEKLIRRHPHIFGDTVVENSSDVLKKWEEIKMKERAGTSRKSLLEGIPSKMPALLIARRLQERAAQVGFDWPEIDGVLDKIQEEIGELKSAIHSCRKDKIQDELGDLLFAMVNLCRWQGINPEEALRGTSRKFVNRFSHIEAHAKDQGIELSSMELDRMEEIWQDSKKLEK